MSDIPTNFSPEAVQAFLLDATRKRADEINASAKNQYLTVTAPNWVLNAKQAQVYKLPMPPKPAPPLMLHINGIENWLIQAVEGPDFVCDPVADLPPLPTPPDPNIPVVQIGQHLMGNFWQALAGDNMPDGTVVIGPDGGSYRKRALPWGGLYEKLS